MRFGSRVTNASFYLAMLQHYELQQYCRVSSSQNVPEYVEQGIFRLMFGPQLVRRSLAIASSAIFGWRPESRRCSLFWLARKRHTCLEMTTPRTEDVASESVVVPMCSESYLPWDQLRGKERLEAMAFLYLSLVCRWHSGQVGI
jgi:hypothetical protein